MKFVLKTVDLDELIVECLLVGVQLVEQFGPMLDVLVVTVLEEIEISLVARSSMAPGSAPSTTSNTLGKTKT